MRKPVGTLLHGYIHWINQSSIQNFPLNIRKYLRSSLPSVEPVDTVVSLFFSPNFSTVFRQCSSFSSSAAAATTTATMTTILVRQSSPPPSFSYSSLWTVCWSGYQGGPPLSFQNKYCLKNASPQTTLKKGKKNARKLRCETIKK